MAKALTKGFSLLEAIVYIAILAAMLAVVVNTLLLIGASYREIKTERLVLGSARSSLERITRESRNALDLDAVGSIFGSHPGRLVLNTTNSEGNPTVIDFYLDEGVLKLREGGLESGRLTRDGVVVDELLFYRVTASSSDAIRVEMTLSASSGPASKTETFYAASVIRGSY